jgi:polysaccharide deacetylase family sporulation protein PdaB
MYVPKQTSIGILHLNKRQVSTVRIIGFGKMKKRLAALAAAALLCTGGIVFFARGGSALPAQAKSDRIPIYSVEPSDSQAKPIALTFNCAWDNGDVQTILDILKQNEITATFFLVGQWAEKYPDSVKAISQAGHEIGNHSYSHADFATLEEKQLVEEISKCSSAIEQITGRVPEFMRPPSGSYSDASIAVIERMGMTPIQWDADSLDWKSVSARQIVKNVTKKAQPGSIVLLHCGAKNTAAALPNLIAKLQKDGYTFTTVGKLIYRDNYSLDHAGRQHLQQDTASGKDSKGSASSRSSESSKDSRSQSQSEPALTPSSASSKSSKPEKESSSSGSTDEEDVVVSEEVIDGVVVAS